MSSSSLESSHFKNTVRATPGYATVRKVAGGVAASALMALGQIHGGQPEPPKKPDTPHVKTEEAQAREALKSIGDRELATLKLLNMKYDDEFKNANALERDKFAQLQSLYADLRKLDPAKDASAIIDAVSKIKGLENDLDPLFRKISEHQRRQREQGANEVRKRFRATVEKPSPDLLKQANEALVSLDTLTLYIQMLDLGTDIKLGNVTLSDAQERTFERLQTLAEYLSYLTPEKDASLILRLAKEMEPLKKDLMPLFKKKGDPKK